MNKPTMFQSTGNNKEHSNAFLTPIRGAPYPYVHFKNHNTIL